MPFLISLLLAQCSFDGGVTVDGDVVVTRAGGNVVTPYMTALEAIQATMVIPGTYDRAVSVLGQRGPSNSGSSADVVLGAAYTRANGMRVVDIVNGGQVVAEVTSNGTFVAGINQGSDAPASFVSSGGSGHLALSVGDGLYLAVGGRLFPGYDGRHGATTVGNMTGTAMDAGFPFEVTNGGQTLTSKVLMIDHQGGIVTFAAVAFADFKLCPSVAERGTLMHANDTNHWYTCTDRGWKQLLEAD